MSSVRLPRSASAAARLMAVVVLPTPPFWFAIATIMNGPGLEAQKPRGIVAQVRGGVRPRPCGAGRAAPRGRLHLVLAEVLGIQALEPLVEPIGVGLVG